jgi:hypothetical protein
MESRWSVVPVWLAYFCAIASMIYFHKGETFFAVVQAFWAVVFFVYWRVKYGRNSLLEFLGNVATIIYYGPRALYWLFRLWLQRRFGPPLPAEIDAAEQTLPSMYYGFKCSCGHITFGGPAPDDPDFFVKGEIGICGKCHSRVEIKPENTYWSDYGPEMHSDKLH